jgi:dTDP-glucose 4,6-dehydratase
MRMRILVAGGAGFIGSHFAERLLAAGDDVVVLDLLTYAGNEANVPAGAEFHRGDVASRQDVDAVGSFDAIVNFAAETHVDRSILGPHDFARTDVLGALELAEVARDRGVRLVQVSTDEVYGDVTEPAREDAPLRPSSPYSASKAGGDLQVLAAVRTYGVDACVTRGSNTYGPRQYPEKLIPLFATNAFDAEPLPLYGDGRQVRDWLHVTDHCAAIELVLREGEPGGIYNIGSGDEHENVDVARAILELTRADPSLLRHVDDRPGHDRRYSLDCSKIRALGWLPVTAFADGLAATVAWYGEHRSWWEPLKSGEYRAYYERQYSERLL